MIKNALRWVINLSFLTKIVIICAGMIGCSICWGLLNAYVAKYQVTSEAKERVEQLAQVATALVLDAKKDAADRGTDKTTAQATAKTVLARLVYGDHETFFILDINGKPILAPKTEGVSSDDPVVRDVYRTLAEKAVATPEGAEYTYEWPENSGTVQKSKIAHVLLVPDWNWVVGTSAALDNIQKRFYQILIGQAAFVSIFLVSMIFGSWGAIVVIANPLRALARNMNALAAGDLSVETPHADREDEVGLIGQAFAVFKDNAVEKFKLQQEQEDLRAQTEVEKKRMMSSLADKFESSVGQIVEMLDRAENELDHVAKDLTVKARQGREVSLSATHAVSEANENVNTVAAATEQMSASNAEIAKQIEFASRIADEGMTSARQSGQVMEGLASAAGRIDEVIVMIKGIAEQTNLLALNATIEAARAGEAGKGFSVVAGEVKSLASETAKATGEISKHVLEIQNETKHAKEQMEQIALLISRMSESSQAVRAATGEQTQASQEIAANTQKLAVGTNHLMENLKEVQDVNAATDQAANDVVHAIETLRAQTSEMERQIHDFVERLRTA